MSQNSFFAKTLRFIGILLMGLTGGFTLLGGIGTSCAALFPTRFGSMAALAPFQWLYILFVLTGIAIGVWGIRATVKLVKGAPDSYKMSMQALVAGVVIGFIHIYASRALRGKSMPVDAVVYTTVLTLIVFLLFRIPGIWQGVNFDKGGSNRTAGGGGALSRWRGQATRREDLAAARGQTNRRCAGDDQLAGQTDLPSLARWNAASTPNLVNCRTA